MSLESVYSNFMKFNFQTGFRSLISEFIYSQKNEAFSFNEKYAYFKDRQYILQHVNEFGINESKIYGLSFLLKAQGL